MASNALPAWLLSASDFGNRLRPGLQLWMALSKLFKPKQREAAPRRTPGICEGEALGATGRVDATLEGSSLGSEVPSP